MALSMPLHHYIESFLKHLSEGRNLADKTITGYRQELGLLNRNNVRLEPDDLAEFVSVSPGGARLAPATRNRRLVIVRAFCRYLVGQGVLAADPTSGISRCRVPRRSPVAMGVTEIGRVLAAVKDESSSWRRARDEAIVATFFYTGLRVGALRSLDVSQVDLSCGLLRGVHHKGAHTNDVVVNPAASGFLTRWISARPASESPALFVNGDGGRLSVRMIQKRLKALGEAAGLGVAVHPHALRHAHATALLRVGVPTELIRISLNHSSLATTALYLHADDELLRQALSRLPVLDPGQGKNK